MSINNQGIFTILIDFVSDKALGIKVRADRMMLNLNDVASAINSQLDRFGKKLVQADLNFNQHKLTNLAIGVLPSDAINRSQLDSAVTNIKSMVATTTQAGLITLATPSEAIIGTNNTKAVTPLGLSTAIRNAVEEQAGGLPYEYISGFLINKNTTTRPARNLIIYPGAALDVTNIYTIKTDTPMSKSIDAPWAQGGTASTPVGGMGYDITLTASTKYNVFVIASLPVQATNGQFATPDISNNITGLSTVSDGFIRVVVNGENTDITGINLSGVANLEQIAAIISPMLTGAVMSAEGNTLIVQSARTGTTSSVNLSTIPGGTGTDLSLSEYFDVAEGTATPGSDYVPSAIDFGFDLGNTENASNLLNENGPAYAAGFRLYRLIGFCYVDASSNIIFRYNWRNVQEPIKCGDFCDSANGTPYARNGWLPADGSAVPVGENYDNINNFLAGAYGTDDATGRSLTPKEQFFKEWETDWIVPSGNGPTNAIIVSHNLDLKDVRNINYKLLASMKNNGGTGNAAYFTGDIFEINKRPDLHGPNGTFQIASVIRKNTAVILINNLIIPFTAGIGFNDYLLKLVIEYPDSKKKRYIKI